MSIRMRCCYNIRPNRMVRNKIFTKKYKNTEESLSDLEPSWRSYTVISSELHKRSLARACVERSEVIAQMIRSCSLWIRSVLCELEGYIRVHSVACNSCKPRRMKTNPQATQRNIKSPARAWQCSQQCAPRLRSPRLEGKQLPL